MLKFQVLNTLALIVMLLSVVGASKTASPKSVSTILSELRDLMKNKVYVSQELRAYIIPSGDAHQSEYNSLRHKRREYVTKFTGSTGVAVVTAEKALLWTDGRYYVQAGKELDEKHWTLMKSGLSETPDLEEWLGKTLESGDHVGVDANLLSLDEWRRISEALKKTGQKLVRCDPNLVDIIWESDGMPDEPHSELIALSDKYSGSKWEDKVAKVQKKLSEQSVYGLVVAALDEVAWLFNLRGADIPYNPVFMSYAIVTVDNISLFINETRLQSKKIRDHLHLNDDGEDLKLKVFPYEGLHEELRALGKLEKKIWISSKDSCALSAFIPQDFLKSSPSPIAMMKAVKNEVEIEGMKRAHVRDAVALCEYLMWLENEVNAGTELNEITAATKLEEFRREQENFVSLSFESSSASGPNAALPHYAPSNTSARAITKDDLYLIDSGGQYMDGTTDVTRTIHLGTPTAHMKEVFTRVLKGHINIAQCKFPNGTSGHVFDILARTSLWEVGLDYPHGTGHGIGAFLNVHEGPIGISPRLSEETPFYPGMFLSNEPGYYEDGKFGIRTESIFQTKKVNLRYNYGDKGYLAFEATTLVPIQQKMLQMDLLSRSDKEWLNQYHANVLQEVGGLMQVLGKDQVYKWLTSETKQIEM